MGLLNVKTSKESITHAIEQLLAKEPSYFLIEVNIKPTNNIQVLVDGDEGISVSKCAQLNHALYKKIQEAAWFSSGEFSLEVSSPGVDKPLIILRQYYKNIGRKIKVVQNDNFVLLGLLTSVTDDNITLQTQEGKGKKATQKEISILFNNIKTATVQIQF